MITLGLKEPPPLSEVAARLAESFMALTATTEAALIAFASMVAKMNEGRDEFMASLTDEERATYDLLSIDNPEWGWVDLAAEIEQRRTQNPSSSGASSR